MLAPERRDVFIPKAFICFLLVVIASTLAACSQPIGSDATVVRSQNDPVGDAAEASNEFGQKPQAVPPGADLASVRLTRSRESLRVLLRASEPIKDFPYEGDPRKGPSWFLRLWNSRDGETPTYFIGLVPGKASVSRPGLAHAIRVLVCENLEGAGCSQESISSRLTVQGSTIEITIPERELPRLSKTFHWVASSSWNASLNIDRVWEDYVPDLGDDGGISRAPFAARHVKIASKMPPVGLTPELNRPESEL